MTIKTMKSNDKVVHNGNVYYSIAATARLLHTTTPKIKEMMGKGQLEWTQLRINGRQLILAQSILPHMK